MEVNIIDDSREKLQSTSKTDRICALKKLMEFCQSTENSVEDLLAVYDKCYLHILKCYSDKFESCRELSCCVVGEFLRRFPRNDFHLHNLITTIAGRIGKKEMLEESEEMRLMFLSQLKMLIQYFTEGSGSKGDSVLKCYDEIIDTVKITLSDPCPAVQLEACLCVKELGNLSSFHYRAEALAEPLFPIVHHKHFRNRITAIDALCTVALHIRSSNDCIPRILSEITQAVMDPIPIVRKECGKAGCRLLLELRDRYSYFEKLIPIVLCGLNDDSPEVRVDIQKLWEKCGELYFNENETELRKIQLVDRIPDNYPENVQRPTLGCRALAQRCLRIVKPIMMETSDWKEEVRLHSLKLLWQFVLHTEEALTPKFLEIYPDLSRACKDEEVLVSKKALEVAKLLGRLLKYEDWFLHGINAFNSHPNLGYLKCFYAIYSASSVSDMEHMVTIAEIINRKEFSQKIDEEFQRYTLKLAMVLCERYKAQQDFIEAKMENISLNDLPNIEENLYSVAIKIMALCFENDHKDNFNEGNVILEKLTDGGNEITKLHKKYLANILTSLEDLNVESDDQNISVLLLYGFIRICYFRENYFNEMKNCIKVVLTDGTIEAKVKIFSAISVAMLSWNETMCIQFAESLNLMKNFVQDVILEHLQWKPGSSAESLRLVAIATICSLSEGAPLEAQEILPEFVEHFSNLLEDNTVSIRLYALRCFNNFGEIKLKYFKKLSNCILQRLDDPHHEVRKWAARVISKLRIRLDGNEENEIFRNHIKYILSTLMLHFNNPEPELKKLLKESIIQIGNNFPDAIDNAFNEDLQRQISNKEDIKEFQILLKLNRLNLK